MFGITIKNSESNTIVTLRQYIAAFDTRKTGIIQIEINPRDPYPNSFHSQMGTK